MFAWHQEDGVYIAVQLSVHQGHAKLVFIVGKLAHAANNCFDIVLTGKIHQQTGKFLNIYLLRPGFVRDAFPDKTNPLIGCKNGAFLCIYSNGNDDLVKKTGCPLKDIKVPEGDRIEGTRINDFQNRGINWDL